MSLVDSISSVVTAIGNSLKTKQDNLISGTSIKTINNESILGAGNINISGSGSSTGNVFIQEAEPESNGSKLLWIETKQDGSTSLWIKE